MAQNEVLHQLLDSLPQLLLGMRQINVDEMKIMREMDQEDRRVSMAEEQMSKLLEWGQDQQNQATKLFQMDIKSRELPPKFKASLIDFTGKQRKYESAYRKNLGKSKTWRDRLSPERQAGEGGYQVNPLARAVSKVFTGWGDEESARRKTKKELGYDRPEYDYDQIPEELTLDQFTRISSSPLFRNAFMSDDLMKALLQQQVMGGGLGLMGGTTGLQDPYGFGR